MTTEVLDVFRGLTALSLLTLLAGCSFSRTVVNGHVRDMDTHWIEPGKTTKAEIVARLGMPPSLIGAKGARPGAHAALGMMHGQKGGAPAIGTDAEGRFRANDARTFRWYSSDTAGKKLEGGWLLYPTFSSNVSRRNHDIFIRFDEKGVVQLVSRTALRDGEIQVLEWREAPR